MTLTLIKKISDKLLKKDRVDRRFVYPEGHCDILEALHNQLKPETYVEIGVCHGRSIIKSLPETNVIGIDPVNSLECELADNIKMFFETSDDFFKRNDLESILNNKKIDLAFIDGMHLFEYALRDFINIEKHSHKDTIITLHDCIPIDNESSAREDNGKFWTGDVFKIILVLKKYRPDLKIYNFSNICVVKNIAPSNNILLENYDKIVQDYIGIKYEDDKAAYDKILSPIVMSPRRAIKHLKKHIKRK